MIEFFNLTVKSNQNLLFKEKNKLKIKFENGVYSKKKRGVNVLTPCPSMGI